MRHRTIIALVGGLLVAGLATVLRGQSIFIGQLPNNCTTNQIPVSVGLNTWSCGSGEGTGTIGGAIASGQVAVGSAANEIAGSANLLWDGDYLTTTTGKGMAFSGAQGPITLAGGDDGFGNTALVIDNADDGYVVLSFPKGADQYIGGRSFIYWGQGLVDNSVALGFIPADNSLEIDATTTVYGNVNIQNGFGLTLLGGNVDMTGDLGVTGAFTVTGDSTVTGAVGVTGDITLAGAITSATTFSAGTTGLIQENSDTLTYLSTTRPATDVFAHTIATAQFGGGGVAATGTLQNHTSNIVVGGAGSTSNEYAAYTGIVRSDIGTGYTQSSGPAGRTWFGDATVLGPVAVQPNLLNGWTMALQNYYNGQSASGTNGAFWAVTKPQIGGGQNAGHINADSYANGVGFGCVGYAHASSADTVGWSSCFKAGGNGSGWMESGSSQIGVGFEAQDFYTAGVSIHGAGDATKPDVLFTGFLDGSEMSAPAAPAANHAVIYVQDNGAGKTQVCARFSSGAAQCFATQP